MAIQESEDERWGMYAMKKVDIADGSVELTIASPNAIYELTGRYQDSREGRSSSWPKWSYVKQSVPWQTFSRSVHFYYLRGDFPKFLEIINPRSVFYKVIKIGVSTFMSEASEDDLRALPEVRPVPPLVEVPKWAMDTLKRGFGPYDFTEYESFQQRAQNALIEAQNARIKEDIRRAFEMEWERDVENARQQPAANGTMSQQRMPFSLREQQATIADAERFLAKERKAAMRRGPKKKKQDQPTDYSQPKRKIRFED